MDKLPTWSFLKTRMGSTIAFVAPLILLVGLAGYLRATTEVETVTLDLDLPRSISMVEGETSIPLDITLRLANRAEEAVDLVALNNCYVLRWFLLDDAGSFIQAQLMEQCGTTPISDLLEPESSLVRTTSIALDAGRLYADAEYHLMVRFWGYETRETFRVEGAD